MSDARRQLLRWIDEDKDKLANCLSAFVRAESPNPPGDTKDAFGVVAKLLDGEGLAYEVLAPKEHMPNLVAEVSGARSGRHLVLNGHLDVFPVNNIDAWDDDPWSGRISDGRVLGRGASDMKAGTMALLFSFIYLARLRNEFGGRLTYTAVSDEETGGRWGSQYLLETLGGRVRGDCVLNAEPGGVGTIRFGEKGILQFKIHVQTRGAHGPYPHLSKSAIRIAGQIIEKLDEIKSLEFEIPKPVAERILTDDAHALIERTMGAGTAEILRTLTVNIGVIRGGTKVNMVASDCDFEVDVRMPPGITSRQVLAKVDEILSAYPEASITDKMITEPNFCDPDHEMVGLISKNVESIGLPIPLPIVSVGGSDCRFWRHSGVPAYIFGPNSRNISAPNESVSIEDYLNALRVQALTALDYLSG